MKMFISAVVMVVATSAYAYGPTVKGLGFVAPQVKTNPNNSVANPQQGEIVFFDTSGVGTAGSLYGYSGSGWKKLLSAGDAGLYGTATYDAASGCFWLNTSAGWSNFSAVASCPTPTVTQNATAPATKIPAIFFSNLPAGSYQVTVTGVVATEADTVCTYRLSDGSASTSWQFLPGPASTGEAYLGSLSGTFTYATAQTNITIQLQANRLGGPNNCKIVDDSVGNMRLEFSVIRL